VRFSIYARLPEPAYDALLTVAEQDFRDPREQAAKFIVEGLRRTGALPADMPTTDTGQGAALEALKT
jgi:hypothetical protein